MRPRVRALFTLCLALGMLALASEAAAQPTATPAIVVYTMGPGDDLFERFGHAAICVHHDGAPERDRCYNYGTADFSSPVPLTWDFLRGRALFWVSVSSPGAMLQSYVRADRSVWRQVLPLDETQARAAAAALAHDALPDNRAYRYHHFHDNCATRVRDLVDRVTGGRLRLATTSPAGRTYRDDAREGFAERRDVQLLLDLLAGRPLDVQPSTYEAAFLPRVLRAAVTEHLGAEPVLVYARKGPAPVREPASTAALWLAFAALLTLPVVVARRRAGAELPRLPLALPAVALFALGLLVWGLSAASTLPELRLNEAALLLLPTDLLLVVLAGRWRRRYAAARVVMLLAASALLAVGVLKQPLWLVLLVPLLPMAAVAWPAPEHDRGASR